MKRLALAALATVSVLLTASGHAHAGPKETAGGVAKTPTATGTGGAAATVDLPAWTQRACRLPAARPYLDRTPAAWTAFATRTAELGRHLAEAHTA
ncbi:hypothetical protein GCM10009557_91000 [Virgisporangium ochraceum]